MRKRKVNGFSRFAIIAISVILLALVSVLFLVFKTNSLYAFSDETMETASELVTQCSAYTLDSQRRAIQQLAEENASPSEITLSGEWYTDMAGITADTSKTVQIGTLTAYTGYPFSAANETFFYDVRKAKQDLWTYLTGLGAPAPFTGATLESTLNNFWTVDSYSSLTSNAKIPSTGSTSSGTKYALVDGVQCYYFAPMPAMLDQKFYSSGDWAKKSCASADYAKVKFAIVLCPKGADTANQSNWVYLPCLVGDVKGHTYPWGVAQTNISVHDSSSVNIAYVIGKDEQNLRLNLGDISTDEAVRTAINDSHFNGYLGNVLDGLYCVFETCGIREYDCVAIKKNYTCVGCITYKE